MTDTAHLQRLRRIPLEWRKRGLLDPDSLAALVESRINRGTVLPDVIAEPAYADFFSAA